MLHHDRESASEHAKQLGHEVRAVKSVVETGRRALPTWTVAKTAVFDSSSEEEEVSRAATASSSDSSRSWAAATPRPDLSDNYTSQDSGSNWDTTTPRPYLSNDWAAPAPRPYLNSCDLTTSNTPVPATDRLISLMSHSLHLLIMDTLKPQMNQSIKFMSPIAKTKDTRPQWTPDA